MKRKRYERPGPFGRDQAARPPRRLLPGRALNPRMQRELRRANYLLSAGEHRRSAAVFAEIALKADDIGIIYPVPMLQLQAAQAALLADDLAASLREARQGLERLAAHERWPTLRAEGQRYLQALQEGGHSREATEITAWLKARLPQPEPTEGDPSAPQSCPYCGANASLQALPARSGTAARCAYCDSVVTLPDA